MPATSAPSPILSAVRVCVFRVHIYTRRNLITPRAGIRRNSPSARNNFVGSLRKCRERGVSGRVLAPVLFALTWEIRRDILILRAQDPHRCIPSALGTIKRAPIFTPGRRDGDKNYGVVAAAIKFNSGRRAPSWLTVVPVQMGGISSVREYDVKASTEAAISQSINNENEWLAILIS